MESFLADLADELMEVTGKPVASLASSESSSRLLAWDRECPVLNCHSRVRRVGECSSHGTGCCAMPFKCENKDHPAYWPRDGTPVEDPRDLKRCSPARYLGLPFFDGVVRKHMDSEAERLHARILDMHAEIKKMWAKEEQLQALIQKASVALTPCLQPTAEGPKGRRKVLQTQKLLH